MAEGQFASITCSLFYLCFDYMLSSSLPLLRLIFSFTTFASITCSLPHRHDGVLTTVKCLYFNLQPLIAQLISPPPPPQSQQHLHLMIITVSQPNGNWTITPRLWGLQFERPSLPRHWFLFHNPLLSVQFKMMPIFIYLEGWEVKSIPTLAIGHANLYLLTMDEKFNTQRW